MVFFHVLATPDLNIFVFFSNSNNSGPISRSEAAKIIKNSKEKPVAKVKPMFRTTEEPVSNSPNLLGDILSRQNDFFKPIDRSNIVPKEPRKSEVKIVIYIHLVGIVYVLVFLFTYLFIYK